MGEYELKTIDPRDYQAQPDLAPPAGYICVVRDVEDDRWRIEGAQHPGWLVEKILAETETRFGIEVVSILETEELSASASQLYDRHQAALGETWLELDEYQVETLRRSVLQIDAHPSHYLKSIAPTAASEMSTAISRGSARRCSPRRRRDRWGFRRVEPARPALHKPPLHRSYGVKALKDYRESEARRPRQNADDPARMVLNMSERFARFRESDEGKALQVILFLLFVAIMCVTDGCS